MINMSGCWAANPITGITFSSVSSLSPLPTAGELIAAIEIDPGPYSGISPQKVLQIASHPPEAVNSPLNETHLAKAYEKKRFFNEEMTQRLNSAAELPENQAKIEQYFSSFGVNAVSHNEPFQRGNLPKAHLLAMCILLDAMQNQELQTLSIAKDDEMSVEEDQKFLKTIFEGFKELFSTQVGQILILRILKSQAQIVIQKGEETGCLSPHPQCQLHFHQIEITGVRTIEVQLFHSHGYQVHEISLGGLLFHEMLHVLQSETGIYDEWYKELSPPFDEYDKIAEFFAIAPVFHEEPWFCEVGFSLEREKMQLKTHRTYALENLIDCAGELISKKQYQGVANLLKSDLYLKDFGLDPTPQIRELTINAILLHPEFDGWLKENPQEKEALFAKLAASPLTSFQKSKEELLSFLVESCEDADGLQICEFLAPQISLQEFGFLKNLLEEYESDPMSSALIASFLKKGAAKEWIQASICDQVALSVLAAKDPNPAGQYIQSIFPVNWILVKKLLAENEADTTYHLLTDGLDPFMKLFKGNNGQKRLRLFLESSCFKQIFDESRPYAFLNSIFSEAVCVCLDKNCSDLWDLIINSLKDADFCSLWLKNEESLKSVFNDFLLTLIDDDQESLRPKALACILGILSRPEGKKWFQEKCPEDDQEFLREYVQDSQDENAQTILQYLTS